MSPYEKPHKTYEEQLTILQDRGLAIRDPESACAGLRRYGYYRLSGYWYPFRLRGEDHIEGVDKPDEQILPGLYFEDIVDICDFDCDLRTLLLGGLQFAEVALRVAIAYELGRRDKFALLHTACLDPRCNQPSSLDPSKTEYQIFREKLDQMILSSNEDFAKHFRDRYNGAPPVWVGIELFEFGMTARCYQLLLAEDRQKVANSFGVASHRTLGSWIQALNVLRNVCAHHGRLNRRHFPSNPSFPKGSGNPEFAHIRDIPDQERHRLYTLVVALTRLIDAIGEPEDWRPAIMSQMARITDIRGLAEHDFGFPEGWRDLEFWNPEPADAVTVAS